MHKAKSRSIIAMLVWVVPLCGFVMLDGCSKSNPAGPNSSKNSIIPLKIGNAWTYNVVGYSSSDSILSSSTVIDSVSTDTTFMGQGMFFVSYLGWCSETDTGFVEYLAPFNQGDQHGLLLFPYPTTAPSTHESWGYVVTVSTMDTLVNISVGSFHCVHYQFLHDNVLLNDYYCSLGVGIVKTITHFTYQDSTGNRSIQMTEVSTLSTYSVN